MAQRDHRGKPGRPKIARDIAARVLPGPEGYAGRARARGITRLKYISEGRNNDNSPRRLFGVVRDSLCSARVFPGLTQTVIEALAFRLYASLGMTIPFRSHCGKCAMSEDNPADVAYRRFAEDRSHRDSGAALEYTKLLIQLIVGGNGLATTALLTLAGALKEHTALTTYVGIPCAAYLAGVVFGVLAAFDYAQAQRTYSNTWLNRARGEDDKAKANQTKARSFQLRGRKWTIWSLSAFVVGSLLAVIVLLIFTKKG